MSDTETLGTIRELAARPSGRLPRPRSRGFLATVRKQKWLYIMSLPTVIGLLLFSYLPMYGIVVAFQRFNLVLGFWKSPWVGLMHFQNFFADPYFFRLIRNTFLLSFWSMVFGFPAPILLALLLNEVRSSFFRRLTQGVSYLPHFISSVVIVGIMYELVSYDGPVNNLLGLMGLDPVNFRLDARWFRPLYVISGLWQGVGWSSIVYLAAIAGIDQELYEAGRIDGCNRAGLMWHVTLPGIAPTIVVLLILRISSLLSVGFEKVYLMYSPPVYETADVIATYVFRRGIEEGNYGYASAVGLFNSVVGFLLLYGANRLSRRVSDYSLW